MTLLEFVNYAKKFCVALAAALGVMLTALSDGHMTAAEWVASAIAFIGAIGVYQVTNRSN